MHNVHYMLALMAEAREAVIKDKYPAFIRRFFGLYYGGDLSKVPTWAREALEGVGVKLVDGDEELI